MTIHFSLTYLPLNQYNLGDPFRSTTPTSIAGRVREARKLPPPQQGIYVMGRHVVTIVTTTLIACHAYLMQSEKSAERGVPSTTDNIPDYTVKWIYVKSFNVNI